MLQPDFILDKIEPGLSLKTLMTKQKKKFMPSDESIAPEALYTVAIVSVIAIVMLIIVVCATKYLFTKHKSLVEAIVIQQWK